MNVEQVKQLTESIQKAAAALQQHCQNPSVQSNTQGNGQGTGHPTQGFGVPSQNYCANPYGFNHTTFATPWSNHAPMGWNAGSYSSPGTSFGSVPYGVPYSWNRAANVVQNNQYGYGSHPFPPFAPFFSSAQFPWFPTGGSSMPWQGTPMTNQAAWNGWPMVGSGGGFGYPHFFGSWYPQANVWGWPGNANQFYGYPNESDCADPNHCGNDVKLAA